MVTLTGSRSGSATVSTSVARAASRPDDLSDNAHRQLIGYIGLVLPFVLIVVAMWRDGVERWRSLDSISAYYYTGALAGFVGMLIALAVFLFAYPGYKNEHRWADLLVAKTAAAAAVALAFFPTRAPDGVSPLTWWTRTTGRIHDVGAVVLLAMFAVFALWLFRLTAKGEQPTADKRRRNAVYLVCGIVIVLCILWAGFNRLTGRYIFWPESVALIAFSLSWLVKGRALRTLQSTARSWLGS
jgi:hypothetical protein